MYPFKLLTLTSLLLKTKLPDKLLIICDEFMNFTLQSEMLILPLTSLLKNLLQ